MALRACLIRPRPDARALRVRGLLGKGVLVTCPVPCLMPYNCFPPCFFLRLFFLTFAMVAQSCCTQLGLADQRVVLAQIVVSRHDLCRRQYEAHVPEQFGTVLALQGLSWTVPAAHTLRFPTRLGQNYRVRFSPPFGAELGRSTPCVS